SGTPPGQLLTGDHNLVNVRVVVNYTIDADRVEDFVVQLDGDGGAERVDALVARAAEAEVAEWVAGRTVDDVLLRGKADLPRGLAGAGGGEAAGAVPAGHPGARRDGRLAAAARRGEGRLRQGDARADRHPHEGERGRAEGRGRAAGGAGDEIPARAVGGGVRA